MNNRSIVFWGNVHINRLAKAERSDVFARQG